MAFSTKKVGTPAQKPLPKGKSKPIPAGSCPDGQKGKKGPGPGVKGKM